MSSILELVHVVIYLYSTLYLLRVRAVISSVVAFIEWLFIIPPHHSQGSSMERWSQNTLWAVPFESIQWRWQYHFMWSSTHDVVS